METAVYFSVEFCFLFCFVFMENLLALDFTLMLKGVQGLFTLYSGKNSVQVLPLRTHINQIFGLTYFQGARKVTEFWKEIMKLLVSFLSEKQL